jgi:hypothetical protein
MEKEFFKSILEPRQVEQLPGPERCEYPRGGQKPDSFRFHFRQKQTGTLYYWLQ